MARRPQWSARTFYVPHYRHKRKHLLQVYGCQRSERVPATAGRCRAVDELSLTLLSAIHPCKFFLVFLHLDAVCLRLTWHAHQA